MCSIPELAESMQHLKIEDQKEEEAEDDDIKDLNSKYKSIYI